TRGLDDDVEVRQLRKSPAVILRAKRSRELGLWAVIIMVVDVNLDSALHAEHCGQQANRSGAGDEHPFGIPVRSHADPLDVLPRFGDDARRLHEHREQAERLVDRNDELRIEAIVLGAESIEGLDAMFGKKAVPAHVPLTNGAVLTRNWIRVSDDADD